MLLADFLPNNMTVSLGAVIFSCGLEADEFEYARHFTADDWTSLIRQGLVNSLNTRDPLLQTPLGRRVLRGRQSNPLRDPLDQRVEKDDLEPILKRLTALEKPLDAEVDPLGWGVSSVVHGINVRLERLEKVVFATPDVVADPAPRSQASEKYDQNVATITRLYQSIQEVSPDKSVRVDLRVTTGERSYDSVDITLPPVMQ